MAQRLIFNIQKKYTKYLKIVEYERAFITGSPKQPRKKKSKMDTNKLKKYEYSAIRAKTAIHDIVACNSFEYFVTLTIAPNGKIDRYNYDDCSKRLSKWLNNNLKRYILVPEKHKDGAYHFHLLADIPKEQLKHHKGTVFNVISYKYGYSTAIKIRQNSEAKLANYIKKYITKDLMSSVGANRRSYWASRNLKRPEKEYNVQLPENAQKVYMTDAFDIYHSPLEE